MTSRKTALFLVALTVLFTMGSALAADSPTPTPTTTTAMPDIKDSYFDFLFGGQIPMTGLSGYDSRFAVGIEFGGKHGAFPLTVSFGQDTYIMGMKPRFQFAFRPFSGLKGLAVVPGVGPVINYWNQDSPGGTTHTIEVGVQPSLRLRYDVTSWFNVIFVPFEMDFNFYRYSWTPGNDGGNSDLQIFYNIGAAVGFNY
jgi:hypothetical protein